MSPEPYQSARDKLLRAREGDEEAREALISENLPLVKYIARRFSGRGAEPEDLFQYGCIGLIKAVDRFDPDYPVQFSTYAVPVIMGEIRRYLRDEGPIHVSRTIRDRARTAQAYAREFTQEHGREPSLEEIAGGTGMDREDLLLAINSQRRVRSLEEPVGGTGELRLMDVVGGDDMDAVDSRLALSKLLRDLPEEERTLILRRYFRAHTQARIASDLGTSQVQVSRMEKRILQRMRRMAEEE